ncbi:MAG: hypothetical protein PHX10_03425 [Gallionellaceae bacterium]|nr:hypothetical protein [Gallionellaceae bacterium]
MQVEIDEQLCERMQSLTTIRLKARDYDYFVDFILQVGLAAVNQILSENPDMTIGDLAMMVFREKPN